MTGRPGAADRLLAAIAGVHARAVLRRFLGAARNATAVQERVLLEKIRRNAASDFGREHGFDSVRSYDDFVRRVPIATYDRLAPYIERVKAGQTGALFGPGQRVRMFALTSGTTDRPKYVPVTDRFLAEFRAGWNAFGVKVLTDHPQAFLRPIVQVTSRMDEEHTSAGIPCGAITGLMATTQKRIVRRYYVTPPAVAEIADSAARYYAIMRLAMAGDVAFFITASPATQLKLARAAEGSAERLIRDIHDGTLDADLDIPAEVRERLAPRLHPDPPRAGFLQRTADRAGRLLPKDVWNLAFLANWMGGTMGLYLKDFAEYFGDTPVRDIGLVASEGRMSIPIQDRTPAGILEVTSNFYEFIPAGEHDQSDPPVLRTHQVEPGGEYFILLTTSAGFYRYDIGDQVRVVDFHGQAPVIEFLHKGLHVSSLTGEKLTEQQVVQAFDRTRRALGLDAATFVLAAQWADPPCYRLHVELPAPGASSLLPSPFSLLSSRLADELDRHLRAVNIEYASKRDSARLGPVEVNVLPPGFLARLEAAPDSASRRRPEQYKHRYLYPQPGADADFPLASSRPTPQPASRCGAPHS